MQPNPPDISDWTQPRWRRQLWGTGARAAPRLTPVYFFQRTLTYTKSDSDYNVDSRFV